MSWAKELWDELRRPLLAVTCVVLGLVLALAVLSAVNGMWPPLLAVESKSMQHSDDTSQVGIIDTGDVVVGRAAGDGEVRTYMGSIADGYSSFGSYGDVVIFQPEGGGIPVVHRAILELVYTGHGTFDIPELAGVPGYLWAAPGADGRWWDLNDTVELFQVGYAHAAVRIDLEAMLMSMEGAPHGGLVTMGDNNWFEVGGKRIGSIDQGALVSGPVPWDSVIGKVVGEVPWIGSLRLWLTGTAPDYLPVNSIAGLIAAIGLIAALPLSIWAMASFAERRGRNGRNG